MYLPCDALRRASVTSRCAFCRSLRRSQGDYHPKYVYSRGVYHPNCYAVLQLYELPFGDSEDNFHDLLGSTPAHLLGSAKVFPLQVASGEEDMDDDESLCDAHLAVLVE